MPDQETQNRLNELYKKYQITDSTRAKKATAKPTPAPKKDSIFNRALKAITGVTKPKKKKKKTGVTASEQLKRTNYFIDTGKELEKK